MGKRHQKKRLEAADAKAIQQQVGRAGLAKGVRPTAALSVCTLPANWPHCSRLHPHHRRAASGPHFRTDRPTNFGQAHAGPAHSGPAQSRYPAFTSTSRRPSIRSMRLPAMSTWLVIIAAPSSQSQGA